MIATRIVSLALSVVLSVVLLAACGLAPVPAGTNDPHEAVNRAWFERNLALDRAFSGETTNQAQPEATLAQDGALADSDTVPSAPSRPSPFARMVSNFGANLGLPSMILNDLLQIRPDRASQNTIRLVLNSTIGLGGLFNPAGAMGIHGRSTDFGETLHRWGVGEGAYVVLPLLGPSSERDAAGLAVDLLIDPLRFVLPRREFGATVAARAAARFADRAEFADLLDANVINTADPYAQARLLYLQTRRYHLGVANQEEIIDPYDEF